MPVIPNKKFEVIRRRQKVADFYVQGWTQTAIAAEVDVSQPNICEDLQQILHHWNPYGQPYPADLMTPKPRATVQ